MGRRPVQPGPQHPAASVRGTSAAVTKVGGRRERHEHEAAQLTSRVSESDRTRRLLYLDAETSKRLKIPQSLLKERL